jgi:hypothetical protein
MGVTNMSHPRFATLPLAGAVLALVGFQAPPAAAQSSMGSREFQRAELNEVSPAIRAEVERRLAAGPGNTVRGILETMLLNEIGVRWPGSRIVATDMGRGVGVIQLPDKTLKAITFNKEEGLKVTGEVVLTN